jgi:hypothetical protein
VCVCGRGRKVCGTTAVCDLTIAVYCAVTAAFAAAVCGAAASVSALHLGRYVVFSIDAVGAILVKDDGVDQFKIAIHDRCGLGWEKKEGRNGKAS